MTSADRRLFASAAALAALAAAAVVAPTQATAAPASTTDLCTNRTRINHRVINYTNIDMYACYGMPGANGRTGYLARIDNATRAEHVILRYRGNYVAKPLSEDWAMYDGGYGETGIFWGANDNELQACADTAYNGFKCAWTANDVG
jgi:hypothetical protein